MLKWFVLALLVGFPLALTLRSFAEQLFGAQEIALTQGHLLAKVEALPASYVANHRQYEINSLRAAWLVHLVLQLQAVNVMVLSLASPLR